MILDSIYGDMDIWIVFMDCVYGFVYGCMGCIYGCMDGYVFMDCVYGCDVWILGLNLPRGPSQ